MALSGLLRAERKLHVLRIGRIPELRLWLSSSAGSASSSSTDRLASAEKAGCRTDGTDASSEKHMKLHSKASLHGKDNKKQHGIWQSIQKYLPVLKESSIENYVLSIKNALIPSPKPVLKVKDRTEDVDAAEANKSVVKANKLTQSNAPSVCTIPSHLNRNFDKTTKTDHASNLKCAEGSLDLINPVRKVFTEDDRVTKVDGLDLAETKPFERKQVSGMKTILQRKAIFAADKKNTETGADLSMLYVFSGKKSTDETALTSESSAYSICSMLQHANEKATLSDNMSETGHELSLKSEESSLEFVKENLDPVASRTSNEDENDTKGDNLAISETKSCEKKQVLGMTTILQRRKDKFMADEITTADHEDHLAKHVLSGNKGSCSVVGILKGFKKVTAVENGNGLPIKNPKLETGQIVSVLSSKLTKKESKPTKNPSVESTGPCFFDFKRILHSNISNSSRNDENEIYLKPLLDSIKNLPGKKKQKKGQVNWTSPITSRVSAIDLVKPLMSLKPHEEENAVHVKSQKVSEGKNEVTSRVNGKVAVREAGEMVDFHNKEKSDYPDGHCKLANRVMEKESDHHSLQITRTRLPNNENSCDIVSLSSPSLGSIPKPSNKNGSTHIPFSGTGRSGDRNCLLIKFLLKRVKKNDIAVAFSDCSIKSINIVQTPLKDKFNFAIVYFQSRNDLEKAATARDVSICGADVVIESNLASSLSASSELSEVKFDPDFPVDHLKRPSHTVAVVNMPHNMSFHYLEKVFSHYGRVTGFAMGSASTAYIAFESKDSVEKVLVSAYLEQKLQIHRVEPPLTTVLRISGLNPQTESSKVCSICDEYGKVWKLVYRDVDIIDVHYKIRELPNMLHIINRLNAMVVDGKVWSVKPATVFPPEILQRLWETPDGRRHILCLIQELGGR